MLNKKGLSTHWFMMIGYMAGIIAFLIMLSSLVMMHFSNSANTYYQEYYLQYNRLVYSKNSIFYYDGEIGRAYPGKVDMKKFSQETLQGLFGEQDNFGVKLSIGTGETQDIFYNRNLYEPAEYVYSLENSVYGGIKHPFPIKIKDNKNSVLTMGLMYRR